MAISSPEMMLVPRHVSAGTIGKKGRVPLTQIDVTKATAADFAADAVFVTDTQIL